MAGKSILSEKRTQSIAEQFSEWYEKQKDKRAALEALGEYDSRSAYDWGKGRRPIPITALRVLYSLTKNTGFLLTKEEKRTYAQRARAGPENPNDPTESTIQEDWPDLELSSVPNQLGKKNQIDINVEEMVSRFKEVTALLQKFAALPSGDTQREKARRKLVIPAMELYTAAMALGLEFPEAFTDLLEQLAFASQISHGAKKL